MASTSTTKAFPNDLSPYVKSLTPEAKQRYVEKLVYDSGTKRLPDPYNLTDKWSTDPNTWPDLTFGDIYLYLIDTPSIYTRESMKAYKSLEAYKYVLSGHVQAVMSHPVADDSPWVFLSKKDGTVYCAHCTCMAGLGEACSHIGAILFKIEMGVKMGITQNSSTSQACQWNSTFRKEVTPATVTEIYSQIKGKRTKPVEIVQADGSADLPPVSVLGDLFLIVPNAAFFTSITVPSQESESRPIQPIIEKYPKLLTSLQDSNINETLIRAHCSTVLENYSVTDIQANNLETATRNQSVSPLWFQHRMGRITASKAHDVMTRKSTTKPDKLTKRIMGYTSYNLSNKKAIKWGVDHEEECRQTYTKHQNQSHVNFECRPSGFIINKTHPFLGASPDGIISCQCCGKGTIEIKCPFKHRNTTVQQAATTDKDFCLDSNLHLKTNHRYFTQVQFQMFIAKCQYCDFVVLPSTLTGIAEWTP